MQRRQVDATTALLLVCAMTACYNDSALENRSPSDKTTLIAHASSASLVATSDTLEAAADAHIRSIVPNINYGAADSITIRTFTGSSSRFTGYVRFDQAAIESRVGIGQLDSARLEFYLKAGGGWPAAGDWLNAYRIPNSWAPNGWTEGGITSNCPNDTNTSNSALDCPGGVWDTTGFGAMLPSDQVLLKNETRNWISFDVTDDVNAWLAGTANRGWHIAKQNSNTNARIVLWSREGTYKPRLVLYASQDTSFRLARIIEPSVQASLSHPDTLLAAGTVVSYNISVAAGHQNVQVTVDGQVVPASGTITMAQAHTLVASADRIVTVSGADQALVQSARSVLLSSNPVTAFQAYLDDVATLVASTSPRDAAARLDAIHFLAYDPILDSAALRLVDGALGGHMFTLGDTARADSLVEGATFMFVNGIWTSSSIFDGAGAHASQTVKLVQENSDFAGSAFDTKLFYNRTYPEEAAETDAEREARCKEMYARRRAFLGHVSEATFVGICALKSYPNNDLTESAQQLINLLRDNSAVDIDANVLADSLQLHRARGRHVLLLPHSQGNLVSQEAILDLRAVYNYSEQTDSTCVGVMSLAAPYSAYSLPVDRTKGIVLEEDAVADWPWNNFDRVTNDSMLPLLTRINTLQLLLPFLQGLAEAPIRAEIFRLGIEIHGLGMYMIPTTSRNRIKDDLKTAYKDCITDDVEIIAPPDFTVLVGRSTQITAKVQNVFGRELKGRRIRWSSLDSAVVEVDSTGRVGGVDMGVGRIVAANRQARDTVQVTILESCAGTGGVCQSWDPTHPCACV